MLRWVRKNVPKKYYFIGKLCAVATIVHVFVMTFSFIYRDNNVYRLNFDRKSAPVILLPFQKTVLNTANVNVKADNSLKKRSVKKSSTILASAQKKSVAKKKTQRKKVAQKKSVAPLKKDTKKPVQNKKPVVAKKIEGKTTKVAQNAKPDNKKENSVVKQDVKPVISNVANGQDDVVYVGQRDLDILHLHDSIRDEIERIWHPPIGLASGRTCRVKVLVGWNGSAEEIEFEESSHILAFDTSIRHALLSMNFPKGAHGKELVIPFS